MIGPTVGALYAAEVRPGEKARPVRVLDSRPWVSESGPGKRGFEWRPAKGWGEQRSPYLDVGLACLYWADIKGSTAPVDELLEYPWEPLPEDAEEAGRELTLRAARDMRPSARAEYGTWLCLRPIPLGVLAGPWAEYDWEQVQKDRQQARARVLTEWEDVNRRLGALGLDAVERELGGGGASVSLAQLQALLDLAER